ncbi:hypothetical protein DSO57_1029531 [Entomophthora muscae]|uniref:Uncharacterized protein n=1 Tax=Entomophthora muscae TaxID=34485 RepID=A0ACC2T1F4_9FUNG|nr:hypothetical protein DSO57_1029531 [Entomophthora muscae]
MGYKTLPSPQSTPQTKSHFKMFQDSLIFCTLAPLAIGFLSAWETRAAVKSKWYSSVKKPWFNPPRFVFAPIWTYLYISTGYALYLVNKHVQDSSPNDTSFGQLGIYAFWVQLLANFIWSKVYFVWRNIDLALDDMVFLSGTAVVTMLCFFSASTLAGCLMLPYVAWALYATALTYSVKQLNEDFAAEPSTN